jgi:hypothetical protein
MSRGRIIAITALVLAAGLAVAFGLRREQEQTATLSDGTVLHLERVSYGRKHTMGLLPSWAEIRRMWAAKRWMRLQLPETEHDTLVIWVRNNGAASTVPVRIGDAVLMNSRARLIPPGLSLFQIGGFTRSEDHVLLGVEEFRIAQLPETRATWRIANPGRAEIASWQPTGLPQAKMIGDTKVRLRQCERWWAEPGLIDVTLRFDMVDPKFPTTMQYAYEPVRAVLMDGMGNAATVLGTRSGEVKFRHPELDPESPAWRARVTFIPIEPPKLNTFWSLNVPGVFEAAKTYEKDFGGTKVRLKGPIVTPYGTGYRVDVRKADSLVVGVAALADAKGNASSFKPQLAQLSPTEGLLLHFNSWPSFTTNKSFRLDLSVIPAQVLEFDFKPPKLAPILR